MDDRRQRYEQLAAQVWQPLQRYLRRRCPADAAEDVLADVLLVLWRRLDDAPAGAELPWAYAVARGCLANARRSQSRRLSLVSRLRPADAEVLRLWAWEGLEARDLATVLDCTAGAAASRLSRARAALREQLRQDHAGAGHKTRREGEGASR